MIDRPLNAFILSLLGGCFVLLGTIVGFIFAVTGSFPPSSLVVPFTLVSTLLGSMILFASVMLYIRPDLHVAWGVAILVLSVGSFTTAFTGFAGFGVGIVGMVLGIIGGALAIGWTRGGPVSAMPSSPFRVCLACGRPYHISFSFCPACGASAMAPPPGGMTPSLPSRPPP